MLYTGGTVGCTESNGVLSPIADLAPYIRKEFGNLRDIKFVHKRLCSVLSEQTDGKILNIIISAVKKAAFSGKYGGIIITLGSDALAYTSAAISYAVGLSKTPCITVCSDLPISEPLASGRANLRAATDIIRSGNAVGALCVYPSASGSVSVYRASRIMQQPPYTSAPVPVGEAYGTVKDGEFFKNGRYTESDDGFFIESARFSALSPIAFISVYPGMRYPEPPRKTKAVILGSYHSGTLNTLSSETAKFAEKCKKRGIRVYVSGISDGADYESMRAYRELGFIRLPTFSSPAAMLIKLWLLNSGGGAFDDTRLFLPLGGDTAAPAEKPTGYTEKGAEGFDVRKNNGLGAF